MQHRPCRGAAGGYALIECPLARSKSSPLHRTPTSQLSRTPAAARRRGECLDQREAAALFAAWQRRGDARARERLTEAYLPLARRLARRYVGAREPIEDLVQVASLGLVKALNRFDPDRGIAFTSFAVPTILGELRRYFRDCGWAVHVPRGTQESALRAEQAVRELIGATGRTPSVRAVAEYLEWEIADALDALEASAAHHASSLDAPVQRDEDESYSLADSIGAPDQRIELIDDRLSVAAATRRLPARERRVLRMRFVDDMTQSQIAAALGVSQMQISRILRSALDRLRELTEA
jgi:RNA polymerase sigma-B factor